VLDLLNSRLEDFAYIRYRVRKYLTAQPARLNSPAELMVLGNKSLEMVQGYTRNKADLLYALDHVPAALQNKGIPGRKNIVWVGHGGPSLFTEPLAGTAADELQEYVHDTTICWWTRG
jgi:hypothetical protein